MLTRILRVNMAERLQAKLTADGLTPAKLAKKLGIARDTITKMLADDWEYITRDPIERVADYVEVGSSDLFEFVSIDFWKPIQEARSCTFLRGFERSRTATSDFKLPRYDKEATNTVESFLHEFFPDFTGGVTAPHRESESELIDRATRENCIVIGSPRSNEACEILISNFFGAKPFDSSRSNRRKIPFGFCWPERDEVVENSSLTCSDLALQETKGKPGIALRGIQIVADYKPIDKFIKWSTIDEKKKYGRDCGLVFVANKPFGDKPVKLIVLAGLSGIGTLAAARALVRNFRDLEPLRGERCVYGIVEGRYTKAANTKERNYQTFDWRYRNGGRRPLNPNKADLTVPI